MNKFLALLGLGLSLNAFSDVPITPIVGEDFVCEDEGVKIAVDLGEMTKETARVWQAEKGETEGMELEVVELSVFRCPDCYEIKTDLPIWGDVVHYRYNTNRNSETGKMTMALRVLDRDNEWKKVKDVPCTKTNQQ